MGNEQLPTMRAPCHGIVVPPLDLRQPVSHRGHLRKMRPHRWPCSSPSVVCVMPKTILRFRCPVNPIYKIFFEEGCLTAVRTQPEAIRRQTAVQLTICPIFLIVLWFWFRYVKRTHLVSMLVITLYLLAPSGLKFLGQESMYCFLGIRFLWRVSKSQNKKPQYSCLHEVSVYYSHRSSKYKNILMESLSIG